MTTTEQQPQTVGGADALAEAPDELLQHRKSQALERWCLNRGFRPSLLQIETERANRARANTKE